MFWQFHDSTWCLGFYGHPNGLNANGLLVYPTCLSYLSILPVCLFLIYVSTQGFWDVFTWAAMNMNILILHARDAGWAKALKTNSWLIAFQNLWTLRQTCAPDFFFLFSNCIFRLLTDELDSKNWWNPPQPIKTHPWKQELETPSWVWACVWHRCVNGDAPSCKCGPRKNKTVIRHKDGL